MATGSPVGDLLELDGDMLLTLSEVHSQQWTRTEELLASVVDLLGLVAYHALIGPHVDPKALKRMKPPEPMPRPGQKRRKRGTTMGQLMALQKELGGGGDG